jgi:hypothetical protein
VETGEITMEHFDERLDTFKMKKLLLATVMLAATVSPAFAFKGNAAPPATCYINEVAKAK